MDPGIVTSQRFLTPEDFQVGERVRIYYYNAAFYLEVREGEVLDGHAVSSRQGRTSALKLRVTNAGKWDHPRDRLEMRGPYGSKGHYPYTRCYNYHNIKGAEKID